MIGLYSQMGHFVLHEVAAAHVPLVPQLFPTKGVTAAGKVASAGFPAAGVSIGFFASVCETTSVFFLGGTASVVTEGCTVGTTVV
jgi:hypothetical protein